MAWSRFCGCAHLTSSKLSAGMLELEVLECFFFLLDHHRQALETRRKADETVAEANRQLEQEAFNEVNLHLCPNSF